jgi:heme o synthase
MIRSYYELMKPRMAHANALMAAAGYIFANGQPFAWGVFGAAVAGLWLVVASGCVFNNIYDRRIDARMERTRTRTLASGRVPVVAAFAWGTLLGVLGFGLLYIYTTPAACLSALIGFVTYVVLYTPLKHRSAHALLVGAVAGAMPAVVGYTAVTNTFDIYAALLFAALFVWQIPHFLAIAIYRFDEYAAAGVPLYVRGVPTPSARRTARKVFYWSLVVLLAFALLLMLQTWIR